MSLCTLSHFEHPGWAWNRVEESQRSGLAVGAVTVHNHPLNCQNLVVQEGRWLLFSRLEASPYFLGSLLVAYKWDPNHHGQDAVSTNPVVSLFPARAFAPYLCNSIWSVSSWPLLICQWPPNPVTQKTVHLELTSKWRAIFPSHQEAERTLKRLEHWVVLPSANHLGLQAGSCCLAALTLGTV